MHEPIVFAYLISSYPKYVVISNLSNQFTWTFIGGISSQVLFFTNID